MTWPAIDIAGRASEGSARETPPTRPQWSSQLAFLAAAVGSAVGLGSIWKFPYVVGANGGGAFVLVYLCFVAAVGIPLMTAELAIGRRGGPSVVRSLATALGRRRSRWDLVGGLSLATGFVILSFYSVVAGWTLAYATSAATGGLAATPAGSAAKFDDLLADPAAMIGWHSLFMAAVSGVVAAGISGGIERTVRWLMPPFVMLLFGLALYAALAGDFRSAAAFLFRPDFAALTPKATLAAAGHAFFTLSLGMGAMIAYGGYLPESAPLGRTAVWVAAADTVCSLAAGLAIFPIVFAFGMDPAEGPGLVFVALPVAFAAMPAGGVVATAFFVLLVIAALVSAVSILEPLVAAWGAVDAGPRRRRRAWLLAGAAWAAGLVSVFSFNLWSAVRAPGIDLGIFDALNHLAAEIVLPLAAIGVALFVGWRAPGILGAEAFASSRSRWICLFLLRFVTPLVVGLVLLDALI